MKRKIVQIAFETYGSESDVSSTAYALADDGTVWLWKNGSPGGTIKAGWYLWDEGILPDTDLEEKTK